MSQSSEASQSVRWLRSAFLGESQDELMESSKINRHFPAFSLLWEHSLQKLISIHAIFFLPYTVLDWRDVDFTKVKGGCLNQQMGFSKRGGLLFFLLSGMKCQEDVEVKQAPAEPLSDSTSCRGCWSNARPEGSHIWEGYAISFSHIWSQRNNNESSIGKTGSKQFNSECKVTCRNWVMLYR